MQKLIVFLSLAIVSFFSISKSNAQKFDIEVDPIAYALSGFSVHVEYPIAENQRIDFGVYGLEVPEFFHNQKNWNQNIWGFGFKWDYFLSGKMEGFFVGIGADYSESKCSLSQSDKVVFKSFYATGVNTGYKFNLFSDNKGGLYIKPWIGFDYTFGDKESKINNSVFEHQSLRIFPTVHLGWSF
jgi:hypothetical protein